jgi:hypothetical protein
LMAGVAAATLLVLAVRPGASSPARAGDQGPAQEKSQAPGVAFHPDLVDQYERMLAGFDRRLSALANLVFEDEDSAQRMRDQVGELMIQATTAQAAYLNAKLAREIAEIEVREYTQGAAVTELAVAEGRLSLAKSGVDQAKRNTAEAKERLARITALANDSAVALSLVYTYTDGLTSRELGEKRAAMELELAESNKKVLSEFTIPKHTKELESAVKKAHADELAKQATWELAKGREEKARNESARKDLPDHSKRILVLVGEAIPLEEKIRAKLEEVSKVEQLPASKADEIARGIHDLGVVVDRAESLRDIGDFARLKRQVQQAVRRYKASAVK